MSRSVVRFASQTVLKSSQRKIIAVPVRLFASETDSLPDTLKRVGNAEVFPNEYPGQDYAFNWCLNGDGVTPLKKSAFRLTKPLDLKLAGIDEFKSNSGKVKAAPASKMPEAGSDDLTFEAFDEVSQRTKDLLSLSDSLYCPEGHVPGTLTGVRVITNSAKLAPQLLAYLDRAPKREPESQSITAYVLEGTEEAFAGYAIEEVEDESDVPTSVSSIVVVGKSPDIKVIVAGLELSQKGLAADEAEREAKRAAEDKAE
eukprot:CAMPEP_0202444788 /NCGR_PEP_ID=MMETSP1360-20130828/3734_1 /ASSEMBLY_ACC=CAM_ASM_000848 /TAXON_ID=515479 /ORGANISM="Licmophora paradoxa, Strain CCMP2313" /LENGTH=256 /DNA_ID=CAMNT_0049060847 /DNA_START=53 /DNA_END=823 /DNA_ORIENTATION=+